MEGERSASSGVVDEFYFTALFDDNELFPISDEKYAEQLQIQEALVSSAISLKTSTTSGSAAPDRSKNAKCMETGQSSSSSSHGQDSSPPELCLICMDAKPGGEMLRITSCSHSFCNDCVAKYVATKIQDNILKVECPDLKCNGVLEPESCSSIVPKEVFERWENLLSESLILGAEKFYCPFKDCSAVLLDDGKEAVTMSECPNCHRLFCAQCKVSWHGGIECREFQKPGQDEREREDILVMELAKANEWRRCPCCKFYVEKRSGCMHITCSSAIHVDQNGPRFMHAFHYQTSYSGEEAFVG
ncbi:hypothetical protein FEM48_Zijuj01G0262900 [Ziziphus jujuba var. spinosa]|uniref:RBR-type E3 ubiquitin transferase n=1 Tax=Ziziphus jujuba var. spinosa TaxID=714518 RepID=A0A978W4Y9_ZIZJJ|nr:hypothetical protein FEM48_Zijuj01G0262900 [Ziziphus jujuba var. spinosa]